MHRPKCAETRDPQPSSKPDYATIFRSDSLRRRFLEHLLAGRAELPGTESDEVRALLRELLLPELDR